jgi:eukaryotic-like serine/threonine-protein kinase
VSDAPIDWARVKAIFDNAVVLHADARAAFLGGVCGSDSRLRQQIEELLAASDRAGTFLETAAVASVERSTDDLIGRTVDTYRIVSHVGAGGMGAVYKAHDSKLDREVALKLLPRDVASNPDHLRRFHTEAHAASSLSHPNILVVHDYGELDGRPFIVSEFVEGETLRQRLDRGPLAITDSIGIAVQIASALSAAHARAIVHRDVKPENVMVRPDGYVKVLDFGIAKLVRPPALDTAVATLGTQTGVLIGTPYYMSPEQAEGQMVDARSDIFSLGVILYEITTGFRPFNGKTPLAVLSSILKDDPPPVTALNPAAPVGLVHIIERCLAKDRQHRYSSAVEVGRDLDAVAQSLRSHENPPSRVAHEQLAPRAPAIDSLAVLPFENATGDPDSEYLSDGITEALINRLSQTSGLRVVPRSTAFRYKGRLVDPDKAGRQLKVRAVLTGKVLQRGDTLSVQVDLVDAAQHAQLWGERFVRRVSDIFAVEDEIADQITDTLRLAVSRDPRDRFARRYTDNTEAYHLFLKGRYYWSKRTRPNLQKSVEYFQQAIALDPDYALAHAGLADAYVVMSVFDAGLPAELLARGKAAARRALDIDPDLAEAHAEMCLIAPSLDRDWAAAADAFQRAMRRRPPYWLAHDHYAFVLAAQGRFDQAMSQVRRGQALEPLSLVVHHHVAWVCVLARRYDEAINECRIAIDMDPTFPMAHLWMGISLEQKGELEDAIRSLDEAVKYMGGASFGAGAAAHAYAMAGQTQEARRRLDALCDARSTRYTEPYGIALVHAALGERVEALRWLEHGYQDHSFWVAAWSNVDPRLDVLRDDPQFRDLLRRLGLGSV